MYKIIRYRYHTQGYFEECLNSQNIWTVATKTPLEFPSRYACQQYYNNELKGERCFAVGPKGGYFRLSRNQKE